MQATVNAGPVQMMTFTATTDMSDNSNWPCGYFEFTVSPDMPSYLSMPYGHPTLVLDPTSPADVTASPETYTVTATLRDYPTSTPATANFTVEVLPVPADPCESTVVNFYSVVSDMQATVNGGPVEMMTFTATTDYKHDGLSWPCGYFEFTISPDMPSYLSMPYGHPTVVLDPTSPADVTTTPETYTVTAALRDYPTATPATATFTVEVLPEPANPCESAVVSFYSVVSDMQATVGAGPVEMMTFTATTDMLDNSNWPCGYFEFTVSPDMPSYLSMPYGHPTVVLDPTSPADVTTSPETYTVTATLIDYPTSTPATATFTVEVLPSPGNVLADAMFLMFDNTSSGDFNTRLALRRCTTFVPSIMDQQTANTYREIIYGAQYMNGCASVNGRGDCVIDYDRVANYIQDEQYEQSSENGYWYAPKYLADDLFLMFDLSDSGDFNTRLALNRCTQWVPSRMNQQTSDTYREIITGTSTQ